MSTITQFLNSSIEDSYGHKKRSISIIQLMFLAFFMVSGGPTGVEDLVGAGGGFYALAGIVLMPFLYSMPQSLMTCELSTMMPDDGGYIIWVRRGLGEFAGWMNSFNGVLSNLVGNALYPSLVLMYLPDLNFSSATKYIIKLAVLALITILNLIGIDVVAWVSIFLATVLILPFLIQTVYCIPNIRPSEQWIREDSENIDWGKYWGTLVWLYTGWDGIGTIAGQVQDPKKTYTLGMLGANFMVSAVNLVPVLSGLTIDSNRTNWVDGHFTDMSTTTAPYLGFWVSISAVLSNLGVFNANFAESSTALSSMGTTTKSGGPRQLPALISFTWKRFGTPIFAILMQTITVIILMGFDFTQILQSNVFLNAISLLLEFASFLYLRYSEPNTPRPYKVPGGKLGAWMISAPKGILILSSFVVLDWEIVTIGCGINVLFVIAYFLKKAYLRRYSIPSLDNESREAFLSNFSGTSNSLVTPTEGLSMNPTNTTNPTNSEIF